MALCTRKNHITNKNNMYPIQTLPKESKNYLVYIYQFNVPEKPTSRM